MKKIVSGILFLLIVTLSSCKMVAIEDNNNFPDLSHFLTETPTSMALTQTASLWPSLTVEPTKTSTPNIIAGTPTTIAQQPTNIPAPTDQPQIPRCVGNGRVNTVIDPHKGIEGTIIYHPLDFPEGLFTIGGQPLQQSKLPDDPEGKYHLLGLSPDGKWLAYQPFINQKIEANSSIEIIILSQAGQKILRTLSNSDIQKTLPPGAVLDTIVSPYWINNHLIGGNYVALLPDKHEVYGYYLTIPVVFDPFRGMWENTLIEDLPDEGITSVRFSRDLSRAIYSIPPDRLVLWDMEAKTILWESNKLLAVSGGIQMVWDAKGAFAAVANEQENLIEKPEVLLISKDGKEVNVIATTKYPKVNFRFRDMLWSPDSNYIAIRDYQTIYLFDVLHHSYLFECEIKDIFPVFFTWSPDSRYIAFGYIKSQMVILDIETGELAELLPYGIPRIWIDTFPTNWP